MTVIVRPIRATGARRSRPGSAGGFGGSGGSEHLVGDAAGDGEHVTVKDAHLQCGDFASPGAAVSGQSGQQQHLLGPVGLRADAAIAGSGQIHLVLLAHLQP